MRCLGAEDLGSDEHGGRGTPPDQSGTRRDGITAVGILFPASEHSLGMGPLPASQATHSFLEFTTIRYHAIAVRGAEAVRYSYLNVL